MKNWLTYIFLWMAGTLGMLTTSCSQEDEELNKVFSSDGKVTVEFSIALGNTGTGSRATWGDQPYDDDPNKTEDEEMNIGDFFENQIILGQFSVNLILSDNSTPIPIQRLTRVDSTDDNVYEFKGEVEVRSPKDLTGAKVEVRANMNSADDSFTTNYTTYPGFGVANIPMWGVHTIDAMDVQNLLLTASSTISISRPIYLLRAMAKIEVALSETLATEGYTLEGVGLNKYNSKGYLLPTGSYGYTDSYDREACFHPYTDANNTSIVASTDYNGLLFQVASDKKSCVIYLPEYNNGNSDLQAKVNIYKGTESISDKLNSQGIFDIQGNVVRNHWYKYTITKINMDTDIEFTLKYQVMNWTDIDNGTLNFGNGDGDVTKEDETASN